MGDGHLLSLPLSELLVVKGSRENGFPPLLSPGVAWAFQKLKENTPTVQSFFLEFPWPNPGLPLPGESSLKIIFKA